MTESIHAKAQLGFGRAGDSYEKGRPEYPAEAVRSTASRASPDA